MKVKVRERDFRKANKHRKSTLANTKKRMMKNAESIREGMRYSKMYGAFLNCKVCGENRAIELCHIIPVRFNGQGSPFNLLCLCPTHHKLFDDGKLSQSEFEAVRDKFHLALKYWSLNKSYAMAA